MCPERDTCLLEVNTDRQPAQARLSIVSARIPATGHRKHWSHPRAFTAGTALLSFRAFKYMYLDRCSEKYFASNGLQISDLVCKMDLALFGNPAARFCQRVHQWTAKYAAGRQGWILHFVAKPLRSAS